MVDLKKMRESTAGITVQSWVHDLIYQDKNLDVVEYYVHTSALLIEIQWNQGWMVDIRIFKRVSGGACE